MRDVNVQLMDIAKEQKYFLELFYSKYIKLFFIYNNKKVVREVYWLIIK